jgi:hypothetical protein
MKEVGRVGALLGVCLCHALLGLVLVSVNRRLPATQDSSEQPFMVVPLPAPAERRRMARPPPLARPTSRTVPSPSASLEPPPPRSPTPSSAITPAPDWSGELARAAQLTLQRQAQEPRQRPFGTDSRRQVIEPSSQDIAPDPTEHFGDGETRTWVNDHCYFTNQAPPDLPAGVPGAPSLWGKTVQVCQRAARPARSRGAGKNANPASADLP